MENFDSFFLRNIEKFEKSKKPVNIDFKRLLPELKPDRATHLIHTYPAKLLMHIPYVFLNNNLFSQERDTVLDSFCGSGTVLLEAKLANRIAMGADANPIARLIARTKTRQYDPILLKEASRHLINSIDRRRTSDYPHVVNLDYWFLPNVQKQLSSIRFAINRIQDRELKDFFDMCFSNLIRKVSLADPKVTVPVRLNPLRYPKKHKSHISTNRILKELREVDVVEKYNDILLFAIKRYEWLSLLMKTTDETIISEDARDLRSEGRKFRKNSVQLIISSPPYAGAQKYVRSSSLSLGWLGYTKDNSHLRLLDSYSIGTEHFNKKDYQALITTGIADADLRLNKIFAIYPKRAHIAAKYLIEMKSSIQEATRVLKPGGYFVLIAANNQVCGEEFKTQEYLCEIACSLGLKVVLKMIDDIKSYGLMTKRNKTADIITREWILVFKKG